MNRYDNRYDRRRDRRDNGGRPILVSVLLFIFAAILCYIVVKFGYSFLADMKRHLN